MQFFTCDCESLLQKIDVYQNVLQRPILCEPAIDVYAMALTLYYLEKGQHLTQRIQDLQSVVSLHICLIRNKHMILGLHCVTTCHSRNSRPRFLPQLLTFLRFSE